MEKNSFNSSKILSNLNPMMTLDSKDSELFWEIKHEIQM